MAETVAALGEQALLEGFQLAGVVLYPAETPEEALHAWGSLPRDVAVVVLTERSAAALAAVLASYPSPMTVVLPS